MVIRTENDFIINLFLIYLYQLDETVTGVTVIASVTVTVVGVTTDVQMTATEGLKRDTGMKGETEMNLQQPKGNFHRS